MTNTYQLIYWPESQDFMEEDWFEDEACLADESFGSSAYFIPLDRYREYYKANRDPLGDLNEDDADSEIDWDEYH